MKADVSLEKGVKGLYFDYEKNLVVLVNGDNVLELEIVDGKFALKKIFLDYKSYWPDINETYVYEYGTIQYLTQLTIDGNLLLFVLAKNHGEVTALYKPSNGGTYKTLPTNDRKISFVSDSTGKKGYVFFHVSDPDTIAVVDFTLAFGKGFIIINSFSQN